VKEGAIKEQNIHLGEGSGRGFCGVHIPGRSSENIYSEALWD